MTRTFSQMAAQGDLVLRRIDALPEGVKPTEAIDGKLVLAHSETGHNHVVLERPNVRQFSAMDELKALLDGKPASYLVVENEPVDLIHERGFDTHETIRIEPGVYELRRQREYTPEGFRRAAD